MERILFISSSTQDRKAWIQTSIVCILPICLLGYFFYRNFVRGNTPLAVPLGITMVVFCAILILGFLHTPRQYILSNTHLIIRRYIKDIFIPLPEIKSVRVMTKDDKKGLLRTFGAEGAFGAYGRYSTSKYKNLRVLVRRYSNWTLVVTDRKKYVIAPDDLQLIDATAQQIGKAEAEIQPAEKTAKQWRRYTPAIIIVMVTVLTYLAYKEPEAAFDSTSFRLKGIYGVNIPFAGIHTADTVTWREMPAISMRTNGISLFKVDRGWFRTTGGDKIRLNTRRGITPVIRIVDNNGAVYYINRKNTAETRQIFKKIQENIKTNQ